MDSTVNYLYESLRSLCPIPESHREEVFQAFVMGLDFGISLSQELRISQQKTRE